MSRPHQVLEFGLDLVVIQSVRVGRCASCRDSIAPNELIGKIVESPRDETRWLCAVCIMRRLQESLAEFAHDAAKALELPASVVTT